MWKAEAIIGCSVCAVRCLGSSHLDPDALGGCVGIIGASTRGTGKRGAMDPLDILLSRSSEEFGTLGTQMQTGFRTRNVAGGITPLELETHKNGNFVYCFLCGRCHWKLPEA